MKYARFLDYDRAVDSLRSWNLRTRLRNGYKGTAKRLCAVIYDRIFGDNAFVFDSKNWRSSGFSDGVCGISRRRKNSGRNSCVRRYISDINCCRNLQSKRRAVSRKYDRTCGANRNLDVMHTTVPRIAESCNVRIKIVRILMIFCMMTVMLHLCSLKIFAQEYTFYFGDDEILSAESTINALADSLPDDLREEFEGISLHDIDGTVKNLQNKMSLGEWFERIFAVFEKYVPQILPSFLPLFSLILLMVCAQAVISETTSVKKSFIQFATLFLAVEVFRMTSTVLDMVRNYLSNLCNVMNFFVPLIETVCLLSGKVTEKAVTSGGLLLIITLIGNFNNIVLVPLTYLLFALSGITMTCSEVRIEGVVGGVRKFIMRLWTVMCIVFSFLLGIQSVLAKAADNLATKTAKFAIGSFIPLAGGMLSEAFTTVHEGMAFVRQATGIGGILIILAMLLPGIIPLALYKVALSVTKAVAEILGVTSIVGLFGEICGIIEFLMAVVLMTSLLFLLALILFTKTNVG